MYTDEQYNKFDKFLLSGLFYMSSQAREVEGVIIKNFKGNNAFDMVAYNIALTYSSAKKKPLYLDMGWFRFIWFKIKHKSTAKKYHNNYLGNVVINTYEMLCAIAKNEGEGLDIVYDIYDSYYKTKRIQ